MDWFGLGSHHPPTIHEFTSPSYIHQSSLLHAFFRSGEDMPITVALHITLLRDPPFQSTPNWAWCGHLTKAGPSNPALEHLELRNWVNQVMVISWVKRTYRNVWKKQKLRDLQREPGEGSKYEERHRNGASPSELPFPLRSLCTSCNGTVWVPWILHLTPLNFSSHGESLILESKILD